VGDGDFVVFTVFLHVFLYVYATEEKQDVKQEGEIL